MTPFIPALMLAQFALLGIPIVSALDAGRHRLRRLLLAPAIGMAVLVLVGELCSNAFAIRRFALPLLAVADVAAIAAVVGARLRFPARALWFAAPIAIVLFGVGYPLFRIGADWVAYTNQDLIVPLYQADRLLDASLFMLPNAGDLIGNRDFPLASWIVAVMGDGNRTGSSVLLDLFAAFGHNAQPFVMPFIVAAFCASVLATASLATIRFRRVGPPLVTGVLAATSSMSVWSVYNQHLDQILGLTMLAACVTLATTRAPYRARLPRLIGHALLLSIPLAAFALFYPELLALLPIGWGAFAVRELLRRKVRLDRFATFVVAAVTFTILLLNIRAAAPLEVASYLSARPTFGFPEFLVPSGLAALWGFVGRSQSASAAILSAAIFAGGILLAVTLLGSLRYALRGYAPAAICLALLASGVAFVVRKDGYSALKVAMYVQPFALATLAVLAADLEPIAARLVPRIGWLRLAPTLALAVASLAGLNAAWFYLNLSMDGETSTAFSSFSGASGTHLISRFAERVNASPATTFLSDTPSSSLALYEADALRGKTTLLPSRDALEFLMLGGAFPASPYSDPRNIERARFLQERRDAFFRPATFAGTASGGPSANFSVDSRVAIMPPNQTALIVTPREMSVLNRDSTDHDGAPELEPLATVRNHLVFIRSNLGRYGGDPFGGDASGHSGDLALGVPQPDPFSPDTMQSLGRYQLLEVLGASKPVRVRLDISSSFSPRADEGVLSPVVYGAAASRMPGAGDGAARLYSEPVAPRSIGSGAYLLLDLGRPAVSSASDQRTGIIGLYNRDVPLDPRTYVAYARNISLVGEREYDERAIPSALRLFPDDLMRGAGAYSGFFEDGWIGDVASVELRPHQGDQEFAIRGSVPDIGGAPKSRRIQVAIDGKTVVDEELPVGSFFRSAALPRISLRGHTITIHSDGMNLLPVGDERAVSVRLTFIGFL